MAKTRKTELDIDLDLKIEEEVKKDPEVEAPPPPPEKKEIKGFSSKFKLIALLSSIFLIIILSLVIYSFISYRPKKKAPEPEKPAEVESVTFSKTPQYQFEPFFLPVKTKKDKKVFLKVAFSLELSNELVITEIEQNSAILRANLSFLFNKKSLSDLQSDPDKKKLTQEIINILNRSFQKGTVKKVYFTQFFLK